MKAIEKSGYQIRSFLALEKFIFDQESKHASGRPLFSCSHISPSAGIFLERCR